MTTIDTVAEKSYVPAIFAGLVASLVGIGLARFAYTPLLPVMIHEHWFESSQVAFLGAANLAGYLIGAMAGRAMARYMSAVMVMRLMTLLASISFLACAFPFSEVWFFCWRLLSGITGGAIMVLVSGLVLHRVPRNKKGIASGAIFLGIGLGVAISGTLIPFMLTWSLKAAWLALGGIALVLTALSWYAWPAHDHTQVTSLSTLRKGKITLPLKMLFIQYALAAIGLVPEMLFLVDYISRSLGHGNSWGAVSWIFYGIGAMIGPVVYGLIADRWGARRTLTAVYLLQLVAVLVLSCVNELVALMFVAMIIGSFPAGVVPLAIARLHDLVNENHLREAMWSRLTVAFAVAQAIGGYFYSAVYSWTGGHHVVTFSIAALAFLFALLIGRSKKVSL